MSEIDEIDPDRFPKLKSWNRDSANSTNLEAFLASPTGQLLLDVLREFAIPEQNIVNLGMAHTNELQARLAFMQLIQSGQNLTVENLLALRHPAVVPEQGDLGEWTGGTRIDRQMEAQKAI